MFEPASAIRFELEAARPAARRSRIAHASRCALMTARRELTMLIRGRALRAIASLLVVTAWLPPTLLALRKGALGVASFGDSVALALAFSEIALPIVGLLCGADMIAGEGEDGTLVPVAALPISRGVIFAGKFIARAALLAAVYAAAFCSAAVAIAALKGAAGWLDYAAVGSGGLALCVVSFAIGALLGAAGRGRTRAFGAAMIAWIVMVFALDALLLAAVVALAPPAPEDAASHGYGEMAAQMEMMKLHEMDDAGPGAQERAGSESGVSAAQWLMALDPVDLFRVSVVSAAPALRQGAKPWLGDGPAPLALAVSWLGWIVVPLGIAMRRFSHADLR